MKQAGVRGHGPMHILILFAVAASMVALPALIPTPALAYESYLHGGIEDCETCHVNAHTWWTPTNEHCLGCHAGYQVPRPGLLCWTCHTPSQDMSSARGDAACTAPCHLPDGSTVTHSAHPDRPATCTACHPVTASPSDPAGSPHHFVPAPVLSGLAPGAGLPGAQVVLTGSNLRSAVVVSFSGVWTTFVVDSDTQITAVVPAGATSGPVSVITRGGQASSTQRFVVTVTPRLSLGVRPLTVSLGRRVTVSGVLTPVRLAGSRVAVALQFRRDGAWKTTKTVVRGTSPAGAYAWSYLALRKGAYRAKASLAQTPANTTATTPWSGFRVK